jgi:hypothetical protein
MAVRPRGEAELVYPKETAPTAGSEVGAPYNATDRDYTNPVRNGTVNITVKSQYYDAWATYFEQRTTGVVTTWDDADRVRLTLRTISGPPGDFPMPDAGDDVSAGAMGAGHPVEDFEATIQLEKNNPHFSFYATEDRREFEIHVFSDVNPNSACPSPDADVHLSVYYADDDGSNQFESWESTALDPDSTPGLAWDCDGGDLQLNVDFVSSGVTMHYDVVGSGGGFDPGTTDDPSCGTATGVTLGNKYAFNEHMAPSCAGWTLASPSEWDQHPAPSVSYEPTSYQPEGVGSPSTESLDAVTNHYLELMGNDVDLVAKDGPGNSDSIDEDASSGRLLYEEAADARFVTFLHVTENEIEVDF